MPLDAERSRVQGRSVSDASPSTVTQANRGQDKPKIPDLDEFLGKRDYQGSIALLQFKRHANRHDVRNLEWLAYCHFHYGEHDKVGGAALAWPAEGQAAAWGCMARVQ
jgi:hypothetical protein